MEIKFSKKSQLDTKYLNRDQIINLDNQPPSLRKKARKKIKNKLSLAELKPIQLSPVQLKSKFDWVRLSWFSKMYIFLGTEN